MTTLVHCVQHLPPIKSVPDRLFKVVDELFAADKAAAMSALFAIMVCEIGTDDGIERAKRMQDAMNAPAPF